MPMTPTSGTPQPEPSDATAEWRPEPAADEVVTASWWPVEGHATADAEDDETTEAAAQDPAGAGIAHHPPMSAAASAIQARDIVISDRPGSRPWPVVAAAVLAAAITLTASGSALVSWRNGQAWETRAVAAERQVTDLNAQLDKSEGAVGSLTTRTRDLADEKAKAEDEREALRLYAKKHAELTRAAGGVSQQLTACIEQLASSAGAASWQVDQTVQDCRDALADYQTLQSLIDSMPATPEQGEEE
jgi:hypothetical protein